MGFKPEIIAVNPVMLMPFAVLLALIAFAPLCLPKFWARHYTKVAFGSGLIVVGYYIFGLHLPFRVEETAHEYFSFVVLIGSLFVVSGGIHIVMKGNATPWSNVVFLLIGAMLANVLGTTGAAMLLIRPWLRSNNYRVTGYHVVFFILIVANVGGCLTPIGDPPLFLGYLNGVPFWWVTEHCLPIWATGVGILLVIFFVVDQRNFRRVTKELRRGQTGHERWKFEGLSNVFFLLVIIGAVFVNHPLFLREGLMIAAALGSYFTTKKDIHAANHFDLHPIKEVAILFAGIFATMMPALDWLQGNAGRLPGASPGLFYWGSGVLSSLLDNAPTYLCFLKTAVGRFADPAAVAQISHLVQTHGAGLADVTGPNAEGVRQAFVVLQKYHPAELARGIVTQSQIQVAYLLGNARLSKYIVAISVGSVFFGANTYIGNGPNFLVKAIADQQKIRTPGFLGYLVGYSLSCMVPMLLVVWWLFFW